MQAWLRNEKPFVFYVGLYVRKRSEINAIKRKLFDRLFCFNIEFGCKSEFKQIQKTRSDRNARP